MSMSVKIERKGPDKNDVYCMNGHLQRTDVPDSKTAWSVAGSCKECEKASR